MCPAETSRGDAATCYVPAATSRGDGHVLYAPWRRVAATPRRVTCPRRRVRDIFRGETGARLRYLKLQRDRRREDASKAAAPLVGGAKPPPELLDAVTGREMASPVRLPSGVVVDRAWAAQHVKRRGTDPYDGRPLAPGTVFESADDIRERIEEFRAAKREEDAPDAFAPRVAGSEVVRRLAGAKALDPTVLDAVLEAERLAASAAAATEAARRKAQRALFGGETDEEEDEEHEGEGRRAKDEETATASATELTENLEAAEKHVEEIEAEA